LPPRRRRSRARNCPNHARFGSNRVANSLLFVTFFSAFSVTTAGEKNTCARKFKNRAIPAHAAIGQFLFFGKMNATSRSDLRYTGIRANCHETEKADYRKISPDFAYTIDTYETNIRKCFYEAVLKIRAAAKILDDQRNG
jgi:hypothetical protein